MQRPPPFPSWRRRPWRRAAAVVLALAAWGGLAAAKAQPAAMSFETLDSPFCPAVGCLLAQGMITTDTPAAFSRALRERRLRPGALVVLDSPGGATMAGMKLGLLIRRAQLATHVQSADCASACAYAYLGGVIRTVGRRARLGVHQFRATDETGELSIGRAQEIAATLTTYLDAMGARAGLLAIALSTPPERIRWLNPGELEGFGVVNFALAADLAAGPVGPTAKAVVTTR